MRSSTAFKVIWLSGILLSASSLYGDEVAQKLKETKESIQEFAYDIADKDTVSNSFDVKSATLSESAVAELKTTLAAVKSDGSVKEILVLAYADKPYPKDEALSTADRKLAKQRGEVVKAAVAKVGGKNIKVYNMAEKASWLGKKIVTTDAQVKNEAGKKPEKQSADDAFYQALGGHLATKGGPGKVVTVMRYNPSHKQQ